MASASATGKRPSPNPPAQPRPQGDPVDSAFDQLTRPSGGGQKSGAAIEPDASMAAHHLELFRGMLKDRARPIRDFILELTVAPTTRRWLDVSSPVVRDLAAAAAALDDESIAESLRAFSSAMERAGKSTTARISGKERQELLAAYQRLEETSPDAFELKAERRRRETLVLRHLLLQVPCVSDEELARLERAGFDSLRALHDSQAEDLIARGGLDPDSAEGVVARVQAYWRERTEHPIEPAQARTKQKLTDVAERLQRAHREFQRAEIEEDRQRKRRARNDRRARALELNVWLAQLGEVDLIGELEHSSTQRRIERVRSYIERLPLCVDAQPEEAS